MTVLQRTMPSETIFIGVSLEIRSFHGHVNIYISLRSPKKKNENTITNMKNLTQVYLDIKYQKLSLTKTFIKKVLVDSSSSIILQ